MHYLALTLLALCAVNPAAAQIPGDFFRDFFRRNSDLRHLGINRRGQFNVPGFQSSYLRHGVPPEALRSGQEQYRVRLVGGRNSREGNVEVLVNDWREFIRGWRSVCDIGWTNKHAAAVCKQLNFPGRAVATRNGRFGFRSSGYGTMVSHCKVGSAGLRRCFHQGLGNTGECGLNNIAGVICGKDRTSVYGRAMKVRLVRGTKWKGDVEVRYGNRGWGPVCGDGFGLREAAVVCRMLKLGAPVRSFLSGHSSSGNFILGEVICAGTTKNLGFCRSRRAAKVRCPGNSFSGAAVECTRLGEAAEDVCRTWSCDQLDFVAGLPDLAIDPQEVQDSALMTRETLIELKCAHDEKCLSSSADNARSTDERTLFRFTNKVQNRGKADYRPTRSPAQWQWHTCHGHYHSAESFSEYDLLVPGTNKKVAEGHKASFCLEDSECTSGVRPRYKCTAPDRSQRPPQGIRAGCADIYGSYIDCQWIDVTDVANGRYTLRIRVNANMLVPEVSFKDNQVICNVQLNVNTETAACRAAGNCKDPSVSVTNCHNVPL